MQKHALSAGTDLLYPANTWPHKNHIRALEALACPRAAQPVLATA
jgi:hypothetical protein